MTLTKQFGKSVKNYTLNVSNIAFKANNHFIGAKLTLTNINGVDHDFEVTEIFDRETQFFDQFGYEVEEVDVTY